MRELLLPLACLLAPWGMALLALSQDRHVARIFGSNVHPAFNTRAQRATGFIAIGLSLTACIGAQGAGFGSLLGLLLICTAAIAMALTLAWRPQWLRQLPLACFTRPR